MNEQEATEILKVSPSTIARAIVLALALINTVFALLGWTPLDIDQTVIYQLVSAAAIVIASVIAYWKNNSWTKPAIKADAVMRELKAAEKEGK